ncbi:mitochondrial ribosomal protein L12 (bL12m) [Andalucia godoyi]|uniref:Mitochondrial ribosomal protein L12 (BL12m) n=1 Tax=Andalucia godoyi TaxID=505711 RepID=A0A8K0AJI1_ANDGO|nr:mitochondrial ribosomal protein L12 (bL12m) [Andalucia godoyi]|eukprot:ANDGO_02836.mRNA.1 mitochondrial ribosomal protein L12 (bL12m)
MFRRVASLTGPLFTSRGAAFRLMSDAIPPPSAPSASPSAQVVSLRDAILALSLSDAAALSAALKEKLGITGLAAPMFGGASAPAGSPAAGSPGASPAAAAAPKEEKTSFNLKLEKYDAAQKIKLIKELRAVAPELGLKEAKDLVEGAPKVFKTNIPKAEAEKIVAKLKEAGGEVILE